MDNQQKIYDMLVDGLAQVDAAHEEGEQKILNDTTLGPIVREHLLMRFRQQAKEVHDRFVETIEAHPLHQK